MQQPHHNTSKESLLQQFVVVFLSLPEITATAKKWQKGMVFSASVSSQPNLVAEVRGIVKFQFKYSARIASCSGFCIINNNRLFFIVLFVFFNISQEIRKLKTCLRETAFLITFSLPYFSDNR